LAGIPGAAVAPSPGLKGAALTTYAGQIQFANPANSGDKTYLARLQGMATQAGTLMLCDRLWHNSGYNIVSTATQVSGSRIVSSSVENPTKIYCSGSQMPFSNGDIVNIQGHINSVPAISGSYTVTVTSGSTFTIPVNVSTGGTGGTVGLALPPRDANGSIAGEQVYLGVEVSGNVGAGTPTLTVFYTDTDGNEANATNVIATVASPIAGAFHPIGLAAGDKGIQTVQSLTLSATWTSGTIHLVAYRVLARLELTNANVPNAIDALTSGFPRLFDNSVPFLIFIPNTTTTSNICGNVIWTQG
jgi:hypothetical protein